MATTVFVTGFGPFGNFPVNASWETAKELKNLDFSGYGINLLTEEIPVVYSTVSEQVPKIWKETNPQLMVNIGVSAYATELTVESLAHRDGYQRPDINGKLPGEADPALKPVIQTSFNLESIVTQFNATSKDGVSSVISTDAGRYLCEYTFFTSLSVSPKRAVFIHVPDIGKPYTVAQMANGVKELILLLVDQMNSSRVGEAGDQ